MWKRVKAHRIYWFITWFRRFTVLHMYHLVEKSSEFHGPYRCSTCEFDSTHDFRVSFLVTITRSGHCGVILLFSNSNHDWKEVPKRKETKRAWFCRYYLQVQQWKMSQQASKETKWTTTYSLWTASRASVSEPTQVRSAQTQTTRSAKSDSSAKVLYNTGGLFACFNLSLHGRESYVSSLL